MVVILMGVSGVGKTTIGHLLAQELGWRFLEGDDVHPPENVAKMHAGVPLTDADRAPWLDKLRTLLSEAIARGENVVLACSALRESYRRVLSVDPERVRWVYLRGTQTLIAQRLSNRRGHFMPASLLDSQFNVLEEPAEALGVDVSQGPQAVVEAIRAGLGV
ncbi:gluconokinase [Stigmatella sp. ncwal1]|uniref:Gluconokinase n=1 Tax=Stigmatella ashevillensis TaxID=2995309 RepID=A0ABT5DBS0_9BACT|nr:gluconokinase [Stigmatella ashevillena]MDC0711083.1 gluconokinase [Stigmatella ashevillena]